jgi:hypothetical protein
MGNLLGEEEEEMRKTRTLSQVKSYSELSGTEFGEIVNIIINSLEEL